MCVDSIIVFTVHKAASMFIYQTSKRLSAECNISFHSPNDYTFPEREILVGGELRLDSRAFQNRTGCFSPIRYYSQIPNLDTFKIVLHLRDPRDVLTSLFYSHAYSHGRKEGAFNPSDKQRKEWIENGADRFVIENADAMLKRYNDYCECVLGRRNVIFIKYEEMVTDFRTWLKKFIVPYPCDNKEEVAKRLVLAHQNDFSVKEENIYMHKRQVQPGDFRRKLENETIDLLTKKFSDVLSALKYV